MYSVKLWVNVVLNGFVVLAVDSRVYKYNNNPPDQTLGLDKVAEMMAAG